MFLIEIEEKSLGEGPEMLGKGILGVDSWGAACDLRFRKKSKKIFEQEGNVVSLFITPKNLR